MEFIMTEYYNADLYTHRKFASSRTGVIGFCKVQRRHAGHFLPALERMRAVARRQAMLAAIDAERRAAASAAAEAAMFPHRLAAAGTRRKSRGELRRVVTSAF
jgi:hypothetical protein